MMEDIKKIENPTSRLRAFSRRRNNLIKKANRLVKECGVQVAIVVISPAGHLSHFSGHHNMGSILERYVSLPLETRYANDPKLKEKQAILAQLEPIQGIENKCSYLDLQTSCLEKQLHILKTERELTEATLRNFELDPAKDPSLEQLDWCEENLMRSLSRLAEKKNELIMKELALASVGSSSLLTSKKIHEMRQALPERSASSILMQLDPWVSPFSTKIRESILEEVKKEENGTKVPGINGVDRRSNRYGSENDLVADSAPVKKSNTLPDAQSQAKNSLLRQPASMPGLKIGESTMKLPDTLATIRSSNQVFGQASNSFSKDRSKLSIYNSCDGRCSIIQTPSSLNVQAEQPLPNADDQETVASDSSQRLNSVDDDEFVVPDDFSWPDEADFQH